SGEATNCLEKVAERLADYTETVGADVRRMRSAAIYPILVSLVTAILFSFTFIFIVPKFLELMRDLGVKEFPLVTQAVLAAGPSGLPLIILVLAPATLLAVLTLGIQRGRSPAGLDALRLRLPVLGEMFRAMALFRLSAMLSV